jgi:hypothetical protein
VSEGGAVADTLALHALVAAYAHHADRREPDLVAALFEPDAVLRMVRRGDDGPPLESRGHRQIASVVGRLRQFPVTYHLVGNHTVAIAGDDASGEAYCVAHHLALREGGGQVDHVMHIRYVDRYRRTAAGWRFAERETHVDWTVDQVVP